MHDAVVAWSQLGSVAYVSKSGLLPRCRVVSHFLSLSLSLITTRCMHASATCVVNVPIFEKIPPGFVGFGSAHRASYRTPNSPNPRSLAAVLPRVTIRKHINIDIYFWIRRVAAAGVY